MLGSQYNGQYKRFARTSELNDVTNVNFFNIRLHHGFGNVRSNLIFF